MIRGASRGAAILGGVATLVIAGSITLDVLLRYFLNSPLLWVDELASFLQMLIIFGGLAHTFLCGGHVRVDLVTGRLSGAARAWLRVATLGLGLAFLGVVVWVTAESAVTAYRYGRVATVTLWPLWLPMLLIPAGLALLMLAMLAALVRQVRLALGPREARDEVTLEP